MKTLSIFSPFFYPLYLGIISSIGLNVIRKTNAIPGEQEPGISEIIA